MSKWSQDQYIRCNVSEIERKGKHTVNPHYISQCTLPLTKISYTNPPPTSMTTLIYKTTPPFCHKWQRVRVLSIHLVTAGRASISIIIIIIIVVGVIIVLGCLRCISRRKGRLHKATKASLPSSNTIDTRVHLIHLRSECIKASIHTLKLCHDHIQSHTSRRSRGSGGGWSWRSGRSCWPKSPRTKLRLALFNDSGVNGHITWKWSETGKGTEKWRKILVIAEGKMSLLRVAISLCTSMIEIMKWKGKSIVRCSKRKGKNQKDTHNEWTDDHPNQRDAHKKQI